MKSQKAVPFIVGVPNIGVSLLWAMNMTLVPLLVSEFTTEKQKIGLLTSMGALTGIFVQYLAGLISDRSNLSWGRRKPFIVGGSLVATLFLCVMPFCGDYWTLFTMGFLFYFSLNFYQGPYYSLIPEVVDHHQLGLANGFAKVIGIVGAGIIFVAGPALWKIDHSYPFFLAAGIGLASVIFTALVIREDPAKSKHPRKLAFDFYRFPSVIELFVAVFFVFLAQGSIAPFFQVFCSEHLKLDPGVASTALLALTLAGAALAWPLGVIADKTDYRKIFLLGTVVYAIGLGLAMLSSSVDPSQAPTVLYAALSIVGVGYIAVNITAFAILVEIVPSSRLGEFMGLMNLFISLPLFLGTIVMGPVIDNFGYQFFLPAALGMMLVAAVLSSVFKFKRDVPDDESLEDLYQAHLKGAHPIHIVYSRRKDHWWSTNLPPYPQREYSFKAHRMAAHARGQTRGFSTIKHRSKNRFLVF